MYEKYKISKTSQIYLFFFHFHEKWKEPNFFANDKIGTQIIEYLYPSDRDILRMEINSKNILEGNRFI